MSLIVSIVGAECTGKTSLAQALIEPLTTQTGRPWVMVPEYLREWCDAAGRTPLPHEQAAIAQTQTQRILAAAAKANVVADTSALMTAIYSKVLFDDPSLLAAATQQERQFDLTVLLAPEFDWHAGDWQRDGPSTQLAVHRSLLEWAKTSGANALQPTGTLALKVQAVSQGVNTAKTTAKQHKLDKVRSFQ
jgi:nicotinamide riboside kinase